MYPNKQLICSEQDEQKITAILEANEWVTEEEFLKQTGLTPSQPQT